MHSPVVEVSGRRLELSNLQKTFFPEKGLSKGDLLKYYLDISPWLLPYLKNRPMVLKRFPDGIYGKTFYQKRCPEYAPKWLDTVVISGEEGAINYCLCSDVPSLLWMINQGCIEIHALLSRVGALDTPDVLTLDLDPAEEVPFEQVLEVASHVKDALDKFGLNGYPKTSGASGIHVYVPVQEHYSYAEIRTAAKLLAEMVCSVLPEHATIERRVDMRGKKVYVDYLQNVKGKTLASVYSVRPYPDATVSAPLKWEEIIKNQIFPRMFTVESIFARLEELGDLFIPVLEDPQALEPVLGTARWP